MCRSSVCSPDAYTSLVQELPRKTATVDTCTHYSELLLYWRIKSVAVYLLPSAAISVTLFEALTDNKVTSQLLAQKKVSLSKERAGCSSARMGHGLGCVILNAWREVLPTASLSRAGLL